MKCYLPWVGLLLLPLIHLVACDSHRDTRTMRIDREQDVSLIRRREMVAHQIRARGIQDEKVLEAMRKVPRHEFVSLNYQDMAYQDTPLPIGHGQTISQPYIVAYMTEALRLSQKDTVLEIGTGSGYQAAVLAEIASQVYTIEIIPELAEHAIELLKKLGYNNIVVKVGDGYLGWPEYAPFDAIILTAAPKKIPEPLLAQLKDGGRLIVPVGDEFQELILVTRKGEKFERKKLIPVRFVPMTGEAQKKHDS